MLFSITILKGHEDYKCDSCGKFFPQTHKLRTHIHTIHKGHKDYKCESCGESFSQDVCLKRHIHTIHEGHKDYNCESCGESFSRAGHLKRHIHTVHKGQTSKTKKTRTGNKNEAQIIIAQTVDLQGRNNKKKQKSNRSRWIAKLRKWFWLSRQKN